MKKKKNKELIIVTGILLGLVLCLLAGNIYLKEAENRQKLEKSQLEKEKETLTEQIRETEEKQTELQKELEKIKKETETDGSLYSGVKDSINNTTQGFYVDKTGQLYLGFRLDC